MGARGRVDARHTQEVWVSQGTCLVRSPGCILPRVVSAVFMDVMFLWDGNITWSGEKLDLDSSEKVGGG